MWREICFAKKKISDSKKKKKIKNNEALSADSVVNEFLEYGGWG